MAQKYKTLYGKRLLAGVCAILITGVLLSGCGRRGALEAPPADRVITTDENGNTVEKPAPKPNRPFILDGLI